MTAQKSGIRSAVVHLEVDETHTICIRSIGKDDEGRLREGIAALSPRSRYLRFMSVAPTPPDQVIDRLLDVDGEHHLAWGAIDMNAPDHPAMGAVHAIRSDTSGEVDMSVAVLDRYQEAGVGTLLTAVLLVDCHAHGIEVLQAQTLAENDAAVRFLFRLGGERLSTSSGVSEFRLEVEPALARLRSNPRSRALSDLFSQLAPYLD